MNTLEKTVFSVWVTGTILAAAVSGVLAPLVGAVALAVGVGAWSRRSLHDRWVELHEKELRELTSAALRVRMNAARAKTAYENAKAVTPKDASPQQKAVLEAARRVMHAWQNDPATAEKLEAHLQELQGMAEPQLLLRDINMSAQLLGLGTFFIPIVPLLFLAMKTLPKDMVIKAEDFRWEAPPQPTS